MTERMECTVVETNNEWAKVRVNIHSDCSSCGLCEGSDTIYYEAENKINAASGQRVILEIEKQSILKAAFLIFVLPMIIIACGSVAGVVLANQIQLPQILTAITIDVALLVPTFILIKKYDSRVQQALQVPVITQRIG